MREYYAGYSRYQAGRKYRFIVFLAVCAVKTHLETALQSWNGNISGKTR